MELNIGNQIKRLRRERDITQEEFASVLGVSYQSVSRWENNTCYPDIELLPTIADFFGISIDRLMGVDEAAEKSKAADFKTLSVRAELMTAFLLRETESPNIQTITNCSTGLCMYCFCRETVMEISRNGRRICRNMILRLQCLASGS